MGATYPSSLRQGCIKTVLLEATKTSWCWNRRLTLFLSHNPSPKPLPEGIGYSCPQISKPARFSDYRPISVTPHLSRITEKVIVRHWLHPAIPADKLVDQYAFKSTGSTTSALVYFTHQATKMLEHNHYVRCLMIDFSKAFDTVDHVILLTKLAQLNIPVYVQTWICSFLSCRSQQCKINGHLSNFVDIGLSIVQGSGIGPTLYTIMKCDLHALMIYSNKCKKNPVI